MDPCRDEEDQTPSLKERNQSQWDSVNWQPHHKRKPLQLWGPALCTMAGGGIQAVPCPTQIKGWWDDPLWLSRLCPWDFMPHTEASGTKDFWTVRQEKTLALAHALQTNTKRSGSKLTLLIPLHLCPLCPTQLPPFPEGKEPWREIGADLNHASEWVCSYVQKNKWVPNWWREFQSLLCPKDEFSGDVQVKGMTHQQAAAFRVPAAQLEKDGWWAAVPCLGVLGQKDYLPLKEFQGMQNYQVVWHEEMVALVMALQRCAIHSGMPPKSSADFSPSTWEGRSTRCWHVGLITQWWVRYIINTSPRPLPRYPWPRCPYNWPCPNPWTNLSPLHGLRSSEQMQHSLADHEWLYCS